jgi:hypothetical protein
MIRTEAPKEPGLLDKVAAALGRFINFGDLDYDK